MYCGRLRLVPVAVKVSTPAEITIEVIDVFVAEARVSAKLKHKNIVNFKGLCIRPPQIAMVMELCEGGNLKKSLTSEPDMWTPQLRVQACLDAARALEHLHAMGYIHRLVS